MSTGSSVRPLRPGQRVWLNHTTGATSRTSTAATSSPPGQERFRVALTPEPAPVDAHRIDEPEDLGHRPWSPLLATSSAAFRSRSRPTCAACFSPEGTTAPLLGPGQSIWAATGVHDDFVEPIADDPPRAALGREPARPGCGGSHGPGGRLPFDIRARTVVGGLAMWI